MKKKIAVVFAAACALALCFALVGCGGGSDDAKANFVGDWKLTEGQAGGETISADDMAQLEELGLSTTFSFKEDGSCTLDLFGAETSGTWEGKSATTASVTIEDETVDVEISDDVLSFSSGEDSLKFKKA